MLIQDHIERRAEPNHPPAQVAGLQLEGLDEIVGRVSLSSATAVPFAFEISAGALYPFCERISLCL